MKKYLPVLQNAPLFSGVSGDEILAMLSCLAATTGDYAKNEFILRRGDRAGAIGLVLAGSVHIIREDFWGNRNILATAAPGQLFAETYACAQSAALAVSVLAAEPATALYLNAQRILTSCSAACAFHARLIRNLLSALAEKNLLMNEKLIHMSQRTTREKLLSYLSAEAQRQGGPCFSVPFNRQQLADYLSVDRSAMSSELGRMRDEGLLQFSRNSFTLLQQPAPGA